MTTNTNDEAYHGDDLAVWPNGVIATLRDVWNGYYNFMSDDYERVRLEDTVRLKELGILEELGIDPEEDWPG